MTQSREQSSDFIVVGLDGSPSARAALDFAARYARMSGTELRAVNVSSADDQLPATWSPEYVGIGALDVPDRSLRRAEIQAVFDSVTPESHWRLDFADGGYGQVLVERAAGAALLVVGTHEHTGLGRILTGSVSHFCLSHAPCPVVAVPAQRTGSQASAVHRRRADRVQPGRQGASTAP